MGRNSKAPSTTSSRTRARKRTKNQAEKLLELIKAPSRRPSRPESNDDLVTLASTDAPKTAKYREALVAFIDILGFRTIVNRSRFISERHEPDLVARIVGALSIPVSDFLAEFRRTFAVPEADGMDPLLEVQTFSDTIVLISRPDREGLAAITYCVYRISRQLLINGFYCRGAVAKGEVFSKTDGVLAPIVFGPAFIKAYDLERAAAVGPRVILCNYTASLIRGVSRGSDAVGKLLDGYVRQEKDGPYTIDVLADIRDPASSNRDTVKGELVAIKRQLERVLDLYTESPNVFQKLRRVADDLNRAQQAGRFDPELRIVLPSG